MGPIWTPSSCSVKAQMANLQNLAMNITQIRQFASKGKYVFIASK